MVPNSVAACNRNKLPSLLHHQSSTLLSVYLSISATITTCLALCSTDGGERTIEKFDVTVESDKFYDLLTDDYPYVDKSLMIAEYLERNETVSLITRPKGWGKSSNLDMLKTFLELEINRTTGDPLAEESRVNCKLFTGGQIVKKMVDNNSSSLAEKIVSLKPLKIARVESITKRYLGKHPVLMVNFTNIMGRNFREVSANIRNVIADLFQKHRYLESSLQRTDVRSDFESYCSGRVNETAMKRSLEFLIQLLYERYGKPVYLLIDDYDKPISNLFYRWVYAIKAQFKSMLNWELFIKAAETKDYLQTLQFLRSTLNNAAKNNTAFSRALITSTFYVPLSENFVESFVNVTEFGLLDETFSDYYGFFDQEMDGKFNGTVRGILADWYGYNIAGKTYYNPWSVKHYAVNGCKLDYYWRADIRERCLADRILMSDEMQRNIHYLLDGGAIEDVVEREAGFEQVGEKFVVLLLYSGYLNAVPHESVRNAWKMSIPNEEVKNLYKKRMVTWICDKVKSSRSNFLALATKLVQFKMADFLKLLRKRLKYVGRLTNTAEKSKIYFNGIVKTLLYSIEDEYDILRYNKPVATGSSSESTDRKPDTVLIAKPNSRYNNAIVLEYKITDNQTFFYLNAEAKVGLQDIHRKFKNIDLKPYRRVKYVLKLCLVFHGGDFASDYFIELND